MMQRETHWYSRFGIEAPFPWLGISIAMIPVFIIVFAITAGMLWR